MRTGQDKTMRRQAGFSVIEMMAVLIIIGILTALSTPMLLRYQQGSQLTLAARELVTFLNTARQLALAQNAPICVHISSTAMHYHQGGCAGPLWLGPGTDASGNIAIPSGMSLSASADPVFSYLGAASPAATYSVTNSQTGSTLHVTVAASGRIAVGP